ncbi:TPA: hypothetical protein QDA84_000461 [Burkholderia vietnamiensis]|nr:hypothetical protein [Burkholderia vietnamiensis]
MELKDAFTGDNAALIRCIKALLELDAASVLSRGISGDLARTLLASAAVRLGAAIDPATVHDVVHALAPPALDGVKIVRAERDTNPSFQEYHAMLTAGGKQHFYAVRVVKMINADGPDAREADHFSAIERRLLAGNPAEAS